MHPEEGKWRGYPLLGVIAYALVPGERRTRAAGHFRKAALEAALGVRALVRSGERASGGGKIVRERIDVE